MRERFAAVVAGTGMLITGCSAETGGQPSGQDQPSQGELQVTAETPFFPESFSPRVRPVELKVGERVMGICLVRTSEESATIATGFMRVRWHLQVGEVPTLLGQNDTFKDHTEKDLAEKYPRCDEKGDKRDDNARAA